MPGKHRDRFVAQASAWDRLLDWIGDRLRELTARPCPVPVPVTDPRGRRRQGQR